MRLLSLTGALVVLLSFSAYSQKSLKTAADQACDCLKENNMGQSLEKDERIVSSCLEEALISNLGKIAKEYDLDLDDENAANQLGLEMGKLLVTDCPDFLRYSLRTAEAEEEAEAAQARSEGIVGVQGTLTGVYNGLDTEHMTNLIITDDSGRKQKLLWLRYFSGSDQLVEDPKALKGKSVTAEWREVEVYLHHLKGYYKVKEITSLVAN